MRDQFKETGLIPVSELLLDQNNYRLGPLENQSDCIEIMLLQFPEQMEKLAEHIAKHGLTPKHIIVIQREDGKWVVKDGNRRVTALKLLNNPSEAPEGKRQLFQKIVDNASYAGGIPDKVKCITGPEDAVIEYMVLEHGGYQDGIGPKEWGAREKENMRIDLGGKVQYPLAGAICDYMHKNGLPEAKKVPITNLHRLFTDKYVTDALGIEWDGSKVVFRANESSSRKLLEEIIFDFSVRGKRVRDIFYKTDRKAYIDGFFEQRGFPRPVPPAAPAGPAIPAPATPSAPTSPAPIVATPPPSTSKVVTPGSSTSAPAVSVTRKDPKDRPRLIPAKHGLPIPDTEAKLKSIIFELSRQIDVRKAPISAALLLRTIIDISANRYVKEKEVAVGKQERLHKVVIRVAEDMRQSDIIGKDYLDIINKLSNAEKSVSINSLHKVAHSSIYIPNPKELCTFYDNIRDFLYHCWKC